MVKQKKRTEFTEERQAIFINHLIETANVSSGAKLAGVARKTVYKFKDARNDTGDLLHPEFAEAWDEAVEEGTDNLVEEARRRAKDGIEKPVGWYQGVSGGTVQEYSDSLLMFLIKARRPEYRERADVTLHGDITIIKMEPGYKGSHVVKKEKKVVTGKQKAKNRKATGSSS